MKRCLLTLILAAFGINGFAQNNFRGNVPEEILKMQQIMAIPDPQCGEMKFKLDSLHNFQLRSGLWNVYARNLYYYTSHGWLDSVIFKDGNYVTTRIAKYIYDITGKKTAYIQKMNVNGVFRPYSKSEWEYLPDGTITTSSKYDFNNGTWAITQVIKQIVYSSVRTDSIVHFKLVNGEWYKATKTVYLYYPDGSVFQVYTIPFIGDIFYAEYEYLKNSIGLTVQRNENTYKTDPLFTSSQLTKTARTSTLYDKYSLADTVYYSIYQQEQWTLQRKSKYFWDDITTDKKILICFNGKPICIPVNTVENYLNRGAYLGPCVNPIPVNQNLKKAQRDEKSQSPETEYDQLKVFPNPVCDVLNISGINNISRIIGFDQNGKQIFNYQYFNENDVRIDMSNQTPGIYFIRIETGENIINRKVILTR